MIFDQEGGICHPPGIPSKTPNTLGHSPTPPPEGLTRLGLLPFDEVEQRMRSAGLTDEGLAWVRTSLSKPARNVQGRHGNRRSEFFSSKMGFSIQTESHSVERVIALWLEWNPDVIGYADQPAPVDALLYARDGRQTGRRDHVLDYLYVRTNGECWAIKCMARDSLEQRLAEKQHLYARNRDGVPQYLPVVETLTGFGVHHRVATPEETGIMFVRNLECLSAYRNLRISQTDAEKIRNAVGDRARSILEVAAAAGVPVDAVLHCISRGDVHVDLNRFPVSETEHTLVHPDLCSMSAYAGLANYKPPALQAEPPVVPGTRLNWDGVLHTVLNRGMAETVLRPDGGEELVSLENRKFASLVASKAISVEPVQTEEGPATQIGDLLLEFRGKKGDEKGDWILQRLETLDQIRHGGLSVDEAALRLRKSPRTVYNYLRAYDAAGSSPGDQFRSQISYVRQPRETPRTDAHERMDALIRTLYYREGRKTKPRPSVRRAHQAYAHKERKAGRTPFSRTTFRKRVQALESVKLLLHRDGRRVANAARPSVGLSSRHLGEWPFHRVQFDGTVMDIALDGYEKEAGPELWPCRPRMLIAVDGYSRAVLGWHIDFRTESSEMALLTVRDLVRRHQRVADITVFDNGSAFRSGAIRRLLVGICRREIEHRPPEEPRFSGQVEAVFKNVSGTLLSGLAGYTGRLQARRKLTKAFNPRKDAVWSLDGLIRLTGAFFALYNDSVNTEIGMSPNQALDEGWKLKGARKNQLLRYDEQFRRATMPATTSRYVLNPRKGFDFRGNRYRNPAVSVRFTGLPEGSRKFHLHFDPADPAEVYAAIDGKLRAFRADIADRLDSLERPEDRSLVARALKVEKYDARREERAGNARLDELLEAIEEEQEALARARRSALDAAPGCPDADLQRDDEGDEEMPPSNFPEVERQHALGYLDPKMLDERGSDDE